MKAINSAIQVCAHWRDRNLLASFDEHMLADIGLTRDDITDATTYLRKDFSDGRIGKEFEQIPGTK